MFFHQRRVSFRAVLASGLLVAWSGTARADTITFKNGHEVHGRLIEETADHVIFQVGNGRLKFPKKDIATFTENADYGQRYFKQPRRADEVGGETTVDGKTLKWNEPKDATAEERRDLRAVHQRIAEELVKLGPKAEERLRKLDAGADRIALNSAIAELGNPKRPSVDFSAFGPKAIGPLSDALASGPSPVKADAALGLSEAVTRGDEADVKWALGRFKTATRLAAALDASGDPAAAAARNAANRALETISLTQMGWADSKEPNPTEAQRTATARWKEWASKEAAAYDAAEKEREAARKKHEDAWRALDDARSWRRALAEAVDAYGTTTASSEKKDGAAPSEGVTNPDIAKDATPDEQKKIGELKASIKKTLEKAVGPTLEERKKKYELTSDERQALQIVLHNLQQSGTRGSQNLIRQNAANELVTYGLKAVELLAETLVSGNVYGRWSSATALGQIVGAADKEDARALCDAHEIPSKLLVLLEESNDGRAAYVRADAAKALAAISGQSIAWPENTDKLTTPAEVEARAQWAAWVSKNASDFQRVERAREDHRKTLNELLKKLDGARSWKDALAAAPKAIEKAERDLKR